MTQSQREALLDLLNLSIFTDSHLSLKEDEALQACLESIGWESPTSREIFLYSSMSRARKASDSDISIAAYIAARATAFPDAASQEKVIFLIQSVFSGDGVAPSEAKFLERLRADFR